MKALMSIIKRPPPRIVALLNYQLYCEYYFEHMHKPLGADAQISPLLPLWAGHRHK
jgi:hypothetical protein